VHVKIVRVSIYRALGFEEVGRPRRNTEKAATLRQRHVLELEAKLERCRGASPPIILSFPSPLAMDYLRAFGSAAVSTIVQKSGLNLPFTLGPKVSTFGDKTPWTLYDGTKRVRLPLRRLLGNLHTNVHAGPYRTTAPACLYLNMMQTHRANAGSSR
jgi:hypothetical protein